jgi:hypothetical protein
VLTELGQFFGLGDGYLLRPGWLPDRRWRGQPCYLEQLRQAPISLATGVVTVRRTTPRMFSNVGNRNGFPPRHSRMVGSPGARSSSRHGQMLHAMVFQEIAGLVLCDLAPGALASLLDGVNKAH